MKDLFVRTKAATAAAVGAATTATTSAAAAAPAAASQLASAASNLSSSSSANAAAATAAAASAAAAASYPPLYSDDDLQPLSIDVGWDAAQAGAPYAEGGMAMAPRCGGSGARDSDAGGGGGGRAGSASSSSSASQQQPPSASLCARHADVAPHWAALSPEAREEALKVPLTALIAASVVEQGELWQVYAGAVAGGSHRRFSERGDCS